MYRDELGDDRLGQLRHEGVKGTSEDESVRRRGDDEYPCHKFDIVA